MDETQLSQVTQAMATVIEKQVPAIVDVAVEKRLSEFKTATAADIEEVKKAIKTSNLESKKETPEAKEKFVKTAVVSIFKEVLNTGANEAQFKSIVDSTIKTMTEGTSGDGAELVFDQFESDILRVINSYELINSVRILPLAKGDKVSLPKATNGITTYFVNEGANYTESEADTAFITIDIAKAATLTDMTSELLDDAMTIPDLYNLIVEFIGESQSQFLEDKILNSTSGAIIGMIPATATANKMVLDAGETADDISDTDLVNMVMKIKKKYKRAGEMRWVTSQYVYGKLMALKTLDGTPLYPELRNFANPSLMGYPLIISDEAPVQDASEDLAGAVTILFGNLKYFTLARRKGLTLERGYYGDNWKKDIQSLKSNQRVGGKVTFDEAFVTLANGV
jgi:HK97 family phage major capsid protein